MVCTRIPFQKIFILPKSFEGHFIISEINNVVLAEVFLPYSVRTFPKMALEI